MTPAQQTALEGVVGRALTAAEISAIDPLLPNRNDVQIAAVLSQGRVRNTPISRSIFAVWAGQTGLRAVIEDHALNQTSQLRASALTLKDFLLAGNDGTIEFSRPGNVQMLNAWVAAGGVTQAQADELVALGQVADPINFNKVSDALNVAEGRMTL